MGGVVPGHLTPQTHASPDAAGAFRLLLRYGVAGVVNTLIGGGAIVAFDVGFGLNPHIANALGFAIGLASAYLLNGHFIFRGRSARGRVAIRFPVAVAAALLTNQAVLAIVLVIRPSASHLWSQLFAMAAYTAMMFWLCNIWVYRSTDALRR